MRKCEPLIQSQLTAFESHITRWHYVKIARPLLPRVLITIITHQGVYQRVVIGELMCMLHYNHYFHEMKQEQFEPLPFPGILNRFFVITQTPHLVVDVSMDRPDSRDSERTR